LNLTLTLACPSLPSLPSLPTTIGIVDLANIDTSPESAYHGELFVHFFIPKHHPVAANFSMCMVIPYHTLSPPLPINHLS